LEPLSFKIACRTGIRPEAFNGRNTQAFVNAKGHRVTEHGFKAFHALTALPDDATIAGLGESKAWPFPQTFIGKAISLVCFSDAIYEYSLGGGTYTQLNTKDAADTTGTTSKAITAGKDWHFVDLYDSWMLFNTACVVFKTKWSEHVFVQDAVTVTTGCVHKEGRVLLGGFNPADYLSSVNWATFWETYAADRPDQAALMESAGAGVNWVWWSSYFAPDMLHLFWQDIMIHQSLSASNTGYGASNPFMLELEELNQSGLRPMPWQGAVQGMLPLGRGVAVYGSLGTSVLNPYGDTYGVIAPRDLPPNFALMNGSDTRTNFAGNEQMHVVVDSSGELWTIDESYLAKRIGRKAEIGALDPDTLMVVHEHYHNEFYIGDGSGDAFLFNKQGFSRAPWMPTQVTTLSASQIYSVSFATDNAAAYTTEKFRGRSQGIECLERILIVGLNEGTTHGWECSLKYRLRPQDDFTSTDWFELDAEGGVDFGLPYLEAEIALRSDDRTKVTLEDILVYSGPMNNPAMGHWMRASTPAAATE
jgi:hypothetical protein